MGKNLFFAFLLLTGLVFVGCDHLAYIEDDKDYGADMQDVDQQVDDNDEGLLRTATSQGILIQNSDGNDNIDLVITVGKKGNIGRGGGAVAYVRWGRSDCPEGADLVYAGRAGGSRHNQVGGGTNYQCLTLEPKNFEFGIGVANLGNIWGVEYETGNGKNPKSTIPLNDFDAPCAVCLVKKHSAKVMIPGTYICPDGWRREYYGFLMTSHHGHYRSTFECVDKDAQGVPGSRGNGNEALFYFVEPKCGSLPCPPYDHQKEVTCAVCTY